MRRWFIKMDSVATTTTVIDVLSESWKQEMQRSLFSEGFAILRLSTRNGTKSIKHSLKIVKNLLVKLLEQRKEGVDDVYFSENDAEELQAAGSHVELYAGCFKERSQLRVIVPHAKDGCVECLMSRNVFVRNVYKTSCYMHSLSVECLESLFTTAGIDESKVLFDKCSSHMDMFHYKLPEDSKASNSLHIPCAAHTDPGILTIISDDSPGLQVQRGGLWETICLGPDQVAVIINRELERLSGGRLKACRHRVAMMASSTERDGRISIAYEIRPNLAGQESQKSHCSPPSARNVDKMHMCKIQ